MEREVVTHYSQTVEEKIEGRNSYWAEVVAVDHPHRFLGQLVEDHRFWELPVVALQRNQDAMEGEVLPKQLMAWVEAAY
jgi:hypothetical protein